MRIDRTIAVTAQPAAGKGLSLDLLGRVPRGVAATSLRMLPADPVSPADGEFWYRTDTNDLCVMTDGAVSRVAFAVDGGADADATAFLTAAGLSDPTISAAVNQLVLDLKAAALWPKMLAVYPMVGSSAANHKWNLKDPRDLDGAYRITWNGSTSHGTTGFTPGGATDCYGDTHLVPSAAMSLNSSHMAFYSRTSTAAADLCEMGAYNSPTGSLRLNLIVRYLGDLYYWGVNETAGSSSGSSSDSRGLFAASRTGSSSQSGYRNGSAYDHNTASSVTLPDVSIFVGQLDGYNKSTDRECAFASVGSGLSDGEMSDLYTAVQAFQTTLGRQV